MLQKIYNIKMMDLGQKRCSKKNKIAAPYNPNKDKKQL
jgi:hypothetical protein